MLLQDTESAHSSIETLQPSDGEAKRIRTALAAMENSLNSARNCSDLGVLRGIEGAAAEEYFAVFDYMVLVPGPDFRFHNRSRRPPMDRINALLSYAYSILALDMRSALEAVGLDHMLVIPC